METVSNKGVS